MPDSSADHIHAIIMPGTELEKDQSFSSGHYTGNGDFDGESYSLMFQSDGNLVFSETNGSIPVVLWASGTADSETSDPGASCFFQTDGNLVIYDAANKPVWSSQTAEHPNALLTIQNDGNLVIYDEFPHALWATNTSTKPDPEPIIH